MSASAREVSQQTLALTTISLDHPSPRPLRKLHPFKVVPKKSSTTIQPPLTQQIHSINSTPPDSPTFPVKNLKFK